jgi:hypothetical protein
MIRHDCARAAPALRRSMSCMLIHTDNPQWLPQLLNWLGLVVLLSLGLLL